MRLVFDTESDDLKHDATVVHCIVTKDVDTKEVFQFYGNDTVPGVHGSILQGLNWLASADEIIGHNIIGHDLPLIKKLHGVEFHNHIVDTLVLSRALNPDRTLPKGCPGSIKNPITGKSDRIGPHSIAAWGFRVGRFKPEFHDWATFSMEMLHRCTEDTEINLLTYYELLKEMAQLENMICRH